MKPYYERNGITLYCGDCLDIMPRLDLCFDALISDWPYGTTQNVWDSVIPLDPLWGEVLRLVKKNGAIMTTAKEPFTSALIMSMIKLFRYRWTWRKSTPTGFLSAKKRPMDNSEDIPVFYRKAPTFNPQMTQGEPNPVKEGVIRRFKHSTSYGSYKDKMETKSTAKYPKLILDFNSVNSRNVLHPTQKPKPLFQYLIRTYTNVGERILDNAAGSGTTLIAAQHEGRRAVGIEKEEGYCELIVKGLRQGALFYPTIEGEDEQSKQAALWP